MDDSKLNVLNILNKDWLHAKPVLATSSDLVDNHFHYHLIGKQLWQKEATRYGWQ